MDVGKKARKHKLFLKSDTQMRGGAAPRVSDEITHTDADVEVSALTQKAAQRCHGVTPPRPGDSF